MGYYQKPTYNMQEYTTKYSEKPQNKVPVTYLGLGDRQPSVQYKTNNQVVSHNNRYKITPYYQDLKNELLQQYQLLDNYKIVNNGQIYQHTPNYKNKQIKYMIGTSPSYLTLEYEIYQNSQDIQKQQNLAKSQQQYQNNQINQHLQSENHTYGQTNNKNVTTQNQRITTSSSANRNLNSPQPYQQKSINQNSQQLQNAYKFDPHSLINQQKALNQFVKETSNSQQNANKIVQQKDYNQINNQKYSHSFQNYKKEERDSNLLNKDHNNPNYEASQINNQSQKINQMLIQKSQQIQNNNQSINKKLNSAYSNSNSAQNNISNKDQTRDSASQSSSRSLITSQNQFELTNYEKSKSNDLQKQQIQSQNVKLRAQEDNLTKDNKQINISSSNTNKIQNNAELKIQEINQKLVQNNSNCESKNKIQNSQKSLAETQTNLQQNQAASVPELLEISIKNPLQQNQQKYNQDNQKQQQLNNESQTQNLTSLQSNLSPRSGRMVEQRFQASKRSQSNDQAQKKTQYDQKQNDSINDRQQIYYKYEQQSNNKEAKSSTNRNNQYFIESKDLNKRQYFDKIKIGLPNIGLTCYINSAIQTLRQVYYFDQKIFENPGFSKDFQQLFQCMEERNTQRISFQIQKIVEKSKQNQKHTFGGDAYMCVYNLLSEIKKSLPDNQKQQFDDLFSRNYKDKLKCGRCKRQKIPNTSQFITCLDYQEFGYECSKLDEAFQDNSDLDLFKEINTDDLTCPTCRDQLQSIRKYKYAPKFMLIRLLSFIPKEQCPNIIDKQFDYLVNLKTAQKYEIVGFCNYYGYHYTYTAKYNNKWIEFNDSNSSEVRPDCSKAIYFLLKRI